MLHRLNLRISPASLLALVALVFALAGTAVALPGKNKVDANDIKKNAVKSKAIKKGAVTTPKLAADAVDGGKLANGSVNSAKIADGAVNSAKIADGSVAAADLVPGVEGARGYGALTNSGVEASKNATITDVGVGEYCIDPTAGSGINPAQATMVVGPYDQDNSQTGSQISYVELEDVQDSNCPNGFYVQTFEVDLAAAAVTAEDESFTFVIP
jgi:hypothetical protein